MRTRWSCVCTCSTRVTSMKGLGATVTALTSWTWCFKRLKSQTQCQLKHLFDVISLLYTVLNHTCHCWIISVLWLLINCFIPKIPTTAFSKFPPPNMPCLNVLAHNIWMANQLQSDERWSRVFPWQSATQGALTYVFKQHELQTMPWLCTLH